MSLEAFKKEPPVMQGSHTLDFIREAEDYLDEDGQQVGPVALFGEDGEPWFWLPIRYWDGKDTLTIEWEVTK